MLLCVRRPQKERLGPYELPWLPESRPYYDGPNEVLRGIRTRRRIPTPAKIAFAGENTCKISIRMVISDTLISRAYQVNTFTEGLRESIKDLYSWIQPFRQPFIVALRLIELLYLL